MEDNDRTRELKNETTRHIVLAKQAVEAVRGVETQITMNALESRIITEALSALTNLIDLYRGETIQETDDESLSYD